MNIKEARREIIERINDKLNMLSPIECRGIFCRVAYKDLVKLEQALRIYRDAQKIADECAAENQDDWEDFGMK